LISSGLAKLKNRYSDHIIEILRLMLKFEEPERPSFVELAKLVLTSTENSFHSSKVSPAKAIIARKISASDALLGQQSAAEKNNNSIEILNKNVSKTFTMKNFGEKNQVNGEDGPL